MVKLGEIIKGVSGKVRWYNKNMYGFVTSDESLEESGIQDVFIHPSIVGDVELREETPVEMDVEFRELKDGKQGWTAIKVTKLFDTFE